MPAPALIDVDALAGPWQGLTVSGLSGEVGSYGNGEHSLSYTEWGPVYARSDHGGSIMTRAGTTWLWQMGSTQALTGVGEWPWQVAWSLTTPGTPGINGTPYFSKLAVAPELRDVTGVELPPDPWLGLNISGISGSAAPLVNGDYVLDRKGDQANGLALYRRLDGGPMLLGQTSVGLWVLTTSISGPHMSVSGEADWPYHEELWTGTPGVFLGQPIFTPLVASLPIPLARASPSDPWQQLRVDGFTGTYAAILNGDYILTPGLERFTGKPYYRRVDGGPMVIIELAEFIWYFTPNPDGDAAFTFSSRILWPYEGTSWNPSPGVFGGTPIFTEIMTAPDILTVHGTESIVAATLATTDAAANSKALLTAAVPGRLGNSIRYRQVTPGTANAAASVTVSGLDVTVNLATNASSAITTTGTQRNALLAASPAASALLTAANLSGNTGAGVCSAIAFTPLTGGASGMPPAPAPLTVS